MRHPDWQLRFSAFAQDRAGASFVWGANDCCTFAATAVEALTGRNPMAEVEPYETEFAAMRLVAEGGGLHALASSLLGTAEPPLMAGVGDVVLVLNEGREMLGVCNGVNVLAPGEAGTVALGMEAAIAVWKI